MLRKVGLDSYIPIVSLLTESCTIAVPTFHPSSSPDLNEALTRFRELVFMPSVLSTKQRLSMFKEKSASRLEIDPIVVNISESEEFTLRPMKQSNLPSKRDAGEVLKMMVATKEYKNLVPFTSGLWKANYRLSPDRWEYLIRHTRAAGKLKYIVQCAKQGEHTGLQLRNVLLVQRLFFELHCMAQESKFDKQQVKQALNMAKEILDIMDAELPDDGSVEQNAKKQPGVIGTMLELSSAHAIEEPGDENLKEVLLFARRLMAALLEKKGPFGESAPTAKTNRQLADRWVQEAVTVYGGLKRCLLVEGFATDKELHELVKLRRDEVKASLQEVLQNRSLRSLETGTWTHAREMLRIKAPRYEPSSNGPSSEASSNGNLQDEKVHDQKP